MRLERAIAVMIPILALSAFGVGCDDEGGVFLPNQRPNTRISAGPPEADDTEYRVNLFWFGWDDDGFVDHYEIAWETPDEWIGPIFTNDSLFTVAASGSCCVPALPEDASIALRDSVYEQFHTFFVRAVDDRGEPDDSPAVRSFNAKTIAPYTEIRFGPGHLGKWGTEVTFKWTGLDDDGVVESYRYALTSLSDFATEADSTDPSIGDLITWVDTLTYYPRPGGGYFTDSLVWRATLEDSVVFSSVRTTFGDPDNKIIFAVRSIDNAGAEERILTNVENVRIFDVDRNLNGPCITLESNVIGTWLCSSPPRERQAFAGEGLRFRWRAIPGGSGTPVAAFRYAVDDTSEWDVPFSINNEGFPPQTPDADEELWFPDGGVHTLFVEAADEGGFRRTLVAKLRIFDGPRFCPEADRYILVVLDTQPGSLSPDFLPPRYPAVELGLIEYYFDGYNIQVHQATGDNAVRPQVALMDCASSIFWFHSSDVSGGTSILSEYHANPPNVLPSYVGSGGNLFLCGAQILNATRYAESSDGTVTFYQNDPVNFLQTLADTTVIDHWMTTQFGIAQIDETVDTFPSADRRVRLVKSEITSGPNPYPDLEYDPLTWPSGPTARGFGSYDVGIRPHEIADSTFASEIIYTLNDTGLAMAVRHLNGPGPTGSTVYAGFHPYWVNRPAYREFLRAVLTDFGEFPVP